METNITEQGNIPEILAPAGTADAMRAAVNAGCDAVYLGGSLFSARAFAGNFDTQEMLRTIDYCHLFGVRLYMTVNTLLKESETGQLAGYMKPFYEAGLDGVIVQDMGVVQILREHFPDLPLHGSTQMSISSAYGAGLLKKLGFTRVVPSRELSLQEIRSIRKQVDIEIEAFVHGAMCYAYSGRCLFSSFLGGRSGNRGRCAQPCRQFYDLQDTLRDRQKTESFRTSQKTASAGDSRKAASSRDRQKTASSGDSRGVHACIMSLKDMCTLDILPQMIDAGIASFKIEGRMKNPSYVAATTDAYRRAADTYLRLRKEHRAQGGLLPSWEELPEPARKEYGALAAALTRKMQEIYNRGGFHTGYYFTDKGPGMFASDRPNHAGVYIGEVRGVQGSDVIIQLAEDVNEQDVLEIRGTDRPSGSGSPDGNVELTSAQAGSRGKNLRLKGRELRKIKPGLAVYRTRNNQLLHAIEEQILKPEKKIRAQATVTARVGEPLSVAITGTSRIGRPSVPVSAVVCGQPVQEAAGHPADSAQVKEKMCKTGGTNMELQVVCDMDDNAFVPMSELNRLRREAILQYKEAAVSVCRRDQEPCRISRPEN